MDKVWLIKYIVHIKSVPQPSLEPWREEDITIDKLKDFMLHYGLGPTDFMYYLSKVKRDGRRIMVELTDKTTVDKMVEEYKSSQKVDLHCYRCPDGFEEPPPKRQCS